MAVVPCSVVHQTRAHLLNERHLAALISLNAISNRNKQYGVMDTMMTLRARQGYQAGRQAGRLEGEARLGAMPLARHSVVTHTATHSSNRVQPQAVIQLHIKPSRTAYITGCRDCRASLLPPIGRILIHKHWFMLVKVTAGEYSASWWTSLDLVLQ